MNDDIKELFCITDGDYTVSVWEFPSENCYRTYVNGHHWDTRYNKDTVITCSWLTEDPLPRFNINKKEKGEV